MLFCYFLGVAWCCDCLIFVSCLILLALVVEVDVLVMDLGCLVSNGKYKGYVDSDSACYVFYYFTNIYEVSLVKSSRNKYCFLMCGSKYTIYYTIF